jgi:hypothetical protein
MRFFRPRAVLTLGAARRNERHRKLQTLAQRSFGMLYQHVISYPHQLDQNLADRPMSGHNGVKAAARRLKGVTRT